VQPPSPILLADGQNAPWAIAVYEDTVYWANQGDGIISAIPRTGGLISYLTTANGPAGLAAGAGAIAWSDHALDRGCTAPLTAPGQLGSVSCIGSATMAPEGIAMSNAQVAFVAATGWDQLVALSSTTIEPKATGQLGITGVAVLGSTVYWTNRTSSTVMSMPTMGGVPTLIAASAGTPREIAASEVGVFWTVPEGNRVDGVLTNGSVTAVSTVEQQPWGIAADATHVYWTNRAGGTVRSASVEEMAVRTLAEGLTEPAGIAVDDLGVYWTDAGAGEVWMLAKAASTD
jgi:hypothetical protein